MTNFKTNKPIARISLVLGLIVLVTLAVMLSRSQASIRPKGPCETIERLPVIEPDYCHITIPPNIAPLNFQVMEPGTGCFVRVHGDHGTAIEVSSTEQTVILPQRAWHDLLQANQGSVISVDVYVRSDTSNPTWTQFKTITNPVAADPIDPYIAYRRIRPGHTTWRDMGSYQRNLETFEETCILENSQYKSGCVNCHTFCNNKTDHMGLGIRSADYGSPEIVFSNGELHRIGTKFGYTCWHPSGTMMTFAVNKVAQVFHSAAQEVRDVFDFDSLITTYDLTTQTIKPVDVLAQKDYLETYPAWAPDGKTLYFCRAPLTWNNQEALPPDYDQIRYDLVRVTYDPDTDTWGQVETVLSAEHTGMSILLPRVSPDGKWLVASMCDYGCFPVYRQSSDLILVDLEAAPVNGQQPFQRLDTVNSPASESWHSFSSNGRWIAFSSKRLSHIFTRTFFAHIDENGHMSKSWVLPQKNPETYTTTLWTYSVPELIREPVKTTSAALAKRIRNTDSTPVILPITMATPKADSGTLYAEPLRE